MQSTSATHGSELGEVLVMAGVIAEGSVDSALKGEYYITLPQGHVRGTYESTVVKASNAAPS